jgi:hypothetical protein
MGTRSVFESWVVTAFDDAGELVFATVVDAIGEADAQMSGCAKMRQRGFAGGLLVERAVTLKARRSP